MAELKPLLRRLHAALPPDIGSWVSIQSIALNDTLEHSRLHAYRVQAPMRFGADDFSAVYFGDHPRYSVWTHHLFGCEIEPVPLGSYSLWQIRNQGHAELKADLALCPVNPWTGGWFARRGWHIVPLFVEAHIELDKPIGELITSKGAKDDLRLARRLGYRFEIMGGDAAIHLFFHQMLLPTVRVRHERRAFLSQWDEIERIYRRGVLIGAHLGEEWVGAVLLAPDEEGHTVRIANIGWRDGGDRWLKNGIAAALYCESYRWAQANGFKRVNLGSCNPFAKDGPLNFKLKMGATLAAPQQDSVQERLHHARAFIAVAIDLKAPAARACLASLPLLEFAGGRLRAIGWHAPVPPLFRRQVELGFPWVDLAEEKTS